MSKEQEVTEQPRQEQKQIHPITAIEQYIDASVERGGMKRQEVIFVSKALEILWKTIADYESKIQGMDKPVTKQDSKEA